MSSIRTRARKDGTTTVVMWRQDGIQRTMPFHDHAKALKWKRLLDQLGPVEALKILGVEQRESKAHELTVDEWCEYYIDNLTGVEPATPKRYRAYVRNDIAPVMGSMPLSTVTDVTVARWVNGMADKKASGKTIANKHGFLYGAFAAAVKVGHMPANPCDGTRLPRADTHEATFLEPDEFALIYAATRERWQPLTNFLVCSGARYGEATALNVADIDAERLTCRISKSWKYAGGAAQLGPPKTKKGNRTINLPAEALTGLDLDRPPGELLFPTKTGRRILWQDFYQGGWRPALDKLIEYEDGKLTKDLLGGKRPSPHDLRHTCASWMIAAGVPLPAIQAHLGHESIVTTISVYGHLDRTAGLVAASAISAARRRTA